MKKFLVGLGIFTLVIVVLFVIFGSFAFIQANKYAPSVEAFVDKFYQAYNNQDVEYIYNQLSGSEFRNISKFEDFKKFIKGTYEKLGAVKGREKGAWKIYDGSQGIIFNVQYKVKRQKADSVDSFTLKKENDSWFLYGYHIDSKDLF